MKTNFRFLGTALFGLSFLFVNGQTFTPSQLRAIPINQVKKIKITEIENDVITDETIEHLVGFTELKELDVSYTSFKDLKKISVLKELEELVLDGCKNISQTDLYYLHLMNLKRLYVRDCNYCDLRWLNGASYVDGELIHPDIADYLWKAIAVYKISSLPPILPSNSVVWRSNAEVIQEIFEKIEWDDIENSIESRSMTKGLELISLCYNDPCIPESRRYNPNER